jgi:hypothetical protein
MILRGKVSLIRGKLMKYFRQFLVLLVVALLGLSGGRALAQFDFQNIDPQQIKDIQQQIQQRLLNSIREELGVTNDVEWSKIEPLIAKVQQGQMDSLMGGVRVMIGNRGGGFPGLGEPDPEADALQSLIEANPSPKQVYEKLTSYRESRKRKADELARNRAQLRQVLTVRQEAILVLRGLLD